MVKAYPKMVVIQIRRRRDVWIDWISCIPEAADEHVRKLALAHGAENVRVRP